MSKENSDQQSIALLLLRPFSSESTEFYRVNFDPLCQFWPTSAKSASTVRMRLDRSVPRLRVTS
ncbi:MAG: hypothetical protein DME59_04415 [Verrucomicrobia bacterium]|nr:MAG: hypothetical protein DME59_04415 [Verrucomicrobiota bacterium]